MGFRHNHRIDEHKPLHKCPVYAFLEHRLEFVSLILVFPSDVVTLVLESSSQLTANYFDCGDLGKQLYDSKKSDGRQTVGF